MKAQRRRSFIQSIPVCQDTLENFVEISKHIEDLMGIWRPTHVPTCESRRAEEGTPMEILSYVLRARPKAVSMHRRVVSPGSHLVVGGVHFMGSGGSE